MNTHMNTPPLYLPPPTALSTATSTAILQLSIGKNTQPKEMIVVAIISLELDLK